MEKRKHDFMTLCEKRFLAKPCALFSKASTDCSEGCRARAFCFELPKAIEVVVSFRVRVDG